jgi:hypothetical protein
MDLSRLRAQVASVEHDLETGDHVVAETLGAAGRVTSFDGPAATYIGYAVAVVGLIAAAALLIAGKHIQGGIILACSAPYQLASLAAARRRPTYIVVTTRRVYLIPLARSRRERARPITRTSVDSVRVSEQRADRFRRVFRLEGRAFRSKGSQFAVTGSWRADLDDVLAAIRAGGDATAAAPAVPGSHAVAAMTPPAVS